MPSILDRVKRVNKLYLAMIIFYIAGSLAIGWSGVLRVLPENTSMVVGEALAGLPVLFYCVIFREKPFGGRYREKLRIPTIGLLIVLGLTVMPFVWLINSVTMMFASNYVAGAVMETQANPLWLNVFLIAVIPAVVEELIFRGVFYSTYSRVNPVRAMLLSGLLFGLLHLNLNQIAYAVPLGILLAMVLEITGNFAAPMIVHFTINGFNTVLAWAALKVLDSSGQIEEALPQMTETAGVSLPAASYVVLFVLGAASAAGVIGLLMAVAATCRRRQWRKALWSGKAPVLLAVNGTPVKKRLGDAFLWIGVGIAVLYTLL
jgi:membrane protease YdiL (CAAX protease family)